MSLSTEYITDDSFKQLASEKGKIAKGIKDACPENWMWIIIEETPRRIVVEIREMREVVGGELEGDK